MTLQEHDHFKHYSEQLQLEHDYGKAELWISLRFAPSPILLSTHWYQKVLLTSGFFFVEEFTPVVLRLKQSLWSGHGKNLNLLFFVAWIAFLERLRFSGVLLKFRPKREVHWTCWIIAHDAFASFPNTNKVTENYVSTDIKYIFCFFFSGGKVSSNPLTIW